ncbi:unnamed protein product [Vicia faba]|uniref:Transposase MuDR plant domain-containing protein n=1 Tax=Vicia faba TaxID=3906 RepID=A0AAV1A0L8_VICFA|nr:unnamed protein product [Vicia faba]
MSQIPQYIVDAHYSGEILISDEMGIIFENIDIRQFKLSRNAKFEYLRERIQTRMQSGAVSQIIYRNAINFGVNQVKYVPLKIRDDDDVEMMFYNHELSGLHAIDLYIKFQLSQQSQISQVANPNDAEPVSIIPEEVVVEDDEEEETESQADDLFTTLFEDGGCDEADAINETEQHIPLENVYCPPAHMTTLETVGDESSFQWPKNPRLPLEDDIAVGNQFKNKSDRVFAISRYHMKHVVDFRVTCSDTKRYKICCKRSGCNFRLVASYRKMSDLWEIGIMEPPHNCSTTIFNQDHRQLSSRLMSERLMPLVEKDPSIKYYLHFIVEITVATKIICRCLLPDFFESYLRSRARLYWLGVLNAYSARWIRLGANGRAVPSHMGDSAETTAIVRLNSEQRRIRVAASAASAVNDITLMFLRITRLFY